MDNTALDIVWVSGLCRLGVCHAGRISLRGIRTDAQQERHRRGDEKLDRLLGLALLFWAFGFVWMFGAAQSGWLGSPCLFPRFEQQPTQLVAFFLFQSMFCATAATIVSGAVAERMRFSAYIAVTIIVSALIYPAFGRWAFGGQSAWLANLGFVDFAGSTVVHGIGGWSALAAVLVIGPRTGRFGKLANSAKSPGSNLPLAMLGTLLLWFGWIGFNGGSTLEMNEHVPKIICNTFLSGAAGMLTALVIGWWRRKHPGVRDAINGSLAGLVAITAGCHAVSSVSALAIGAVGAAVMLGATRVLERFRIDDAVGAFPVHGVAGAWGTLAVALFGSADILATGLSPARQFVVQLTGVVVAGLLAFGATYLLLRLVGHVIRLRVTADEERVGLNIAEHGASTELFDLVTEMDWQYRSSDFTTRVAVEPSSDVGVIAAQYNRVLDKIAEVEADRTELNQRLIESSRSAGMAEAATGMLHNVGNVLNSVNVTARLLMEKSQASRVGSLAKASRVISQHQGDLASFFTDVLAAQELGGSLSVHSDGLGQGAVFTLRIPMETKALCTV